MRVGFTGSRHAISPEQSDCVAARLLLLREEHGADEFHHGDCVEADEVAARHASRLGLYTVGHPPNNDRFRAFFPSDEVREPLPYLVRDVAIVEAVSVLIACPRNPENHDRRSGTWFTVRRARRARIGLMVFSPHGILVEAYRPEVLV